MLRITFSILKVNGNINKKWKPRGSWWMWIFHRKAMGPSVCHRTQRGKRWRPTHTTWKTKNYEGRIKVASLRESPPQSHSGLGTSKPSSTEPAQIFILKVISFSSVFSRVLGLICFCWLLLLFRLRRVEIKNLLNSSTAGSDYFWFKTWPQTTKHHHANWKWDIRQLWYVKN